MASSNNFQPGDDVMLKENIEWIPIGKRIVVPAVRGVVLRIVNYKDDLATYVVTVWTRSGEVAALGEYEVSADKLESAT